MFISHADFNLPSNVIEYLNKHIYTWLFQNGAANLDGIIRLPGRLPIMLIYALFDNLTASYFYLIISYFILGFSFWIFIRTFFKSTPPFLGIVLSIVYTFNPVFLSNTSKIGLVAAVGLLPLCIVLARYFIKTKSIIYLLLLLLCLNYSMLHPYTFAVNTAFTVLYFLYIFFKGDYKLKDYIFKFVKVGIIAIFLHAYIITTIFSIGSISKDVLSQNISEVSVDYTSLIEIANAGSSINTLTLSKENFIDYEYFSGNTYILYITGVLFFYILAFGSYIYLKHRINKRESFIFLSSALVLLTLLFLTSGHEIPNKIIASFVNLPAGWIFRSPLKWQLYIPFFLYIIVGILLYYYKSKARFIMTILIVLAGILQSGYLINEVYTKLILPKSNTIFASMESIPDESRILYLTGSTCTNYLNENVDKLNQLNHVFVNKYIQVKKTSLDNISNINLLDYDYVLICKEDVNDLEDLNSRFDKIDSFDNESFTLYQFETESPKAISLANLYNIRNSINVNKKSEFVSNILNDDLNYTNTLNAPYSRELIQLFEEIDPEKINGNTLSTTVRVNDSRVYKLYSKSKDAFVNLTEDSLFIYESSETSSNTLKAGSPITLLPFNKTLTIQLNSSNADSFKNVINNNSFQNGLWKQEVEDCYNYDAYPNIGMDLITDNGDSSLKLYSGNHIACTSTNFDIKNKKNLFIFYRFKSEQNHTVGASIQFNDYNNTNESLLSKYNANTGDWAEYSNIIKVPQGATTATLRLYGYPLAHNQEAITLYDDIYVFEVPEILTELYLVSDLQEEFNNVVTSYYAVNPVEHNIAINNAKGKVLLKISDTYDRNWQLSLNESTSSIQSIVLNGYTQGWVINVDEICSNSKNCISNPDGTFNLIFNHFYKPQSSFITGLIISTITLITIIAYFVIKKISKK